MLASLEVSVAAIAFIVYSFISELESSLKEERRWQMESSSNHLQNVFSKLLTFYKQFLAAPSQTNHLARQVG